MNKRIDQLLRFGREQGCSDIHLAVGQPPLLRVLGEIWETRLPTISSVELSEMLNEVMEHAQRRSFEAWQDFWIARGRPVFLAARVHIEHCKRTIGHVG